MFIKLLKMRFHPSSPNFVRGVMVLGFFIVFVLLRWLNYDFG